MEEKRLSGLMFEAAHGSKLADDLKREVDAFRNWQGKKKIPG